MTVMLATAKEENPISVSLNLFPNWHQEDPPISGQVAEELHDDNNSNPFGSSTLRVTDLNVSTLAKEEIYNVTNVLFIGKPHHGLLWEFHNGLKMRGHIVK